MSEITRIPLFDRIENPLFRRVMRRAILENRRMVPFDLPEHATGKILAFRKLSTLPYFRSRAEKLYLGNTDKFGWIQAVVIKLFDHTDGSHI